MYFVKDIILITTYCPTQEKEDILRNLVNKIYKIGGFDIFIISHSPIPVDIQNKANFYFYDFENTISSDPDLRTEFWIYTDYGKILTNSYTESTTTLAVYRLMRYGLNFCKTLGYKKVHFLEYDTDLNSLDELVENSKILENKDCVFYTDNGTVDSFLYGPIMSINLDKIDIELLTYDEFQITQKIKNSDMKMCEDHTKLILMKSQNFEVKNRNDLSKSGVLTGLIFGGKNKNQEHDIYTPFWDPRDSTLKFFYWNKSHELIKIRIIKNDSDILVSDILSQHWTVMRLGDFSENMKLIIVVGDDIVRKYNFENFDFENFRKNNRIAI